MCTCIAMKTQDAYFGRSMDIDYRFGEKVVVTPRSYPFALRSGGSFETWYAMVGMAAVQEGYPLYAEATNEKGLHGWAELSGQCPILQACARQDQFDPL